MSTKAPGAGYSAAMHLIPIAVACVATPFVGIIVLLIMWLMKRDETPLIDHHGREALRFQIMMSIYAISGALITFITLGIRFIPVEGSAVMVDPTGSVFVASIIMILAIAIGVGFTLFALFYPIYMAIEASKGKKVTYPLVFSPRRRAAKHQS